jgi:DNA-binding MarR family transcriptional regulator
MESGEPQDILAALGPIAMASRLKRMAERLQADASTILERAGLPIQPNHVGLLAALDRYGDLTVGEATSTLGSSQPAVTRIVTSLQDLGLVACRSDQRDLRAKQISLTPAGRAAIEHTRLYVWPPLSAAVSALCDGNETTLLTLIAGMEERMAEVSMADRVRSDLTILPWSPDRAQAFHDINAAWIEEMFRLEDHDREVLQNPQRYIIDRGGRILFAHSAGLGVVGACALMPTDDGALELTKMGVLASARGQKVGEFLLEATIACARSMQNDCLFLLTSTKCAPAIHLYEKLGFQHDSEIMARYGASYARCNVAMRYVPEA